MERPADILGGRAEEGPGQSARIGVGRPGLCSEGAGKAIFTGDDRAAGLDFPFAFDAQNPGTEEIERCRLAGNFKLPRSEIHEGRPVPDHIEQAVGRSDEPTSELQALKRIWEPVFCWKTKTCKADEE